MATYDNPKGKNISLPCFNIVKLPLQSLSLQETETRKPKLALRYLVTIKLQSKFYPPQFTNIYCPREKS